MSNHMFDELDETCDYVGFIKDGRIIDIVDVEEIHNRPYRNFTVGFYNKEDFDKAFVNTKVQVIQRVENFLQIIVKVDKNNANDMFNELQKFKIKQCSEIKYTLEKYFLDNFGGNDDGGTNS